jgi:HSP20 family molecular chaperone IbpA
MTEQESNPRGTSLAPESEQQNESRWFAPPRPLRLLDPVDIWFAPQVLLEEAGNGLAFPDGSRGRGGRAVWSPVVEVEYRDDKLVINAELPGLSVEDIKVEILGNMLVIQGERRRDDGRGHTIRHSERRYGHFYREITLPDSADTENVRAEFENGTLRVTVPVKNWRVVPINQTSKKSTANVVRKGEAA